jgi:prophage DNA circulation protein
MSGFLDSLTNIASQAQPFIGAASDLIALTGGNWRARLRRASFRGAAFFVDDVARGTGRRLVNHEFPARDIPYSEDLGRKQRTWTFSAYCIGQTYQSDYDALVKACEQAGPGTLIHPNIGSVQATCETGTFTERRDSGGYVAVTLNFFEAGQIDLPTPSDTGTKVDTTASNLTDSNSSSFMSNFSLSGVQQFVSSSAVQQVTQLAGQIGALRIPGLSGQSGLTSALSVLSTGAPLLVQDVTKLVPATQNVFSAFTNTASSPETGFSGMLATALSYGKQAVSSVSSLLSPHGLAATVAPPVIPATADRLAEARNTAAWRSFVRSCALTEMAYNMPGLTLGSADDAQVVRDQLDTAFEDAILIAADAGQDDLFTALLDVKDALLDDLDLTIAQLPSLITYQTPRSVNALTLAWRLYADANRNLELADRTNADDPCFLPITGRVLAT